MAGLGPGLGGVEGPLGTVLGVGSPLGLSDGALVERFAARPGSAMGEAAFGALVARHGAMVRRVCRQTLRSEADADDAYQAVFLVLARRAGAIRDPNLLAPWLYGVALRTARLARRRQRASEPLITEPAAIGPDDCPVEATEVAEALHAEVARLPEGQRRAVVLCHLEGLTHDEAARRLGVPTGTVSVRLMRARERLRDRLTRRGFAPGSPLFPALDRVGPIPPRAWAALSHLRGHAAGEVPVGVASLASGASAMNFGLPKTAALALLTTGLAATGAWSLAQVPARSDPTSLPSSAPQPAARPRPAPAPITPAQNTALAEFNKVYRLEAGHILKRIPPPFAPWRTVEIEIRYPFLKENRERRGHLSTLIYQERNGVLDDPSMTYSGSPNDKGRWLVYLVDGLGGRRFPEVKGPDDLLKTPIPGDWIVASSASPGERIAAFDAILTRECKLPIHLRLQEEEREVIVARGRFGARPVLAGRDDIQFYGATLTPDGGAGGGTGDLTAFFGHLARFIEPHRTIVDEVEARPPGQISWHMNYRSPFTEETTREDRGEAAVLRHVAEQTGLTFTTERRRVPVITVERAE